MRPVADRFRAMTVKISLTLSNRDLRFFRAALKRAREAVRHADDEEIVDAIREVIRDIRSQKPLPDFIADRLPRLESLIDMLSDEEWALPARERGQLLGTFVYFGDPEDLIPDDVPGIGYLDDVIMIELLTIDMRHVSDAYEDFCAFRARLGKGARNASRLQSRRKQLHERMRRRLAADQQAGQKATLW